MPAREDIANERVLVLLPTLVDAERTTQLLGEAQVPVLVCTELAELCRELRAGAGAVLLSDEVILADTAGQLAEAMRGQPPWSAVPLLVLARENVSLHLQRRVSEALRSLIIVERPVRTGTLLSMLLSALRARRHQYQIRDVILERDRKAEELIAQDAKLRFALSAGGLGSWELNLDSGELSCSALCKTNFGRDESKPFSYRELQDSIHPEDKTSVLAAIARTVQEGNDYDVEYRTRWPNGEVHWVMVRGRVAYDADGKPLRMIGVSLDVTERKRMLEALQQSGSELERQAEQLRNADRLKDEFLATLAHELRNPLAPIRTGLELLTSQPESEVAARTLSVMQRQLGHMVRLIDDLLDVSRITQGKLDLKRERISLSAVLETAIEASAPLVKQYGHELQVSSTPEELWLDADFTRIAQVVDNLINNACKYTTNSGTIRLTARKDGPTAIIEVADNGIGIPQDRVEDVFVMFSQVNRKLNRSQGGLGIGLALVRRIVDMHGGTVSAASGGPGQGSTFSVRLPLSVDTVDSRAQREAAATVRAGKRILVVDDNDDAADMLALMLEHRGHTTTVARDGPSAIATAQTWSPQIVFLDIGLPGMSGYDVARELRSDPRFSSTVLVALTGWGTQEDKRRALRAGFDAHLTKPVDVSALQNALSQLANGK